MKIKSLFAILLVLTLLTCTLVIPTSAKESVVTNTDVEIFIHDEVSEGKKAKIEKYFATGEAEDKEESSTYGITCTLFGHKIERTSVSTITHKVRSTSPKCLKKNYAYEECTRCDYENSTLTSSEYIICC